MAIHLLSERLIKLAVPQKTAYTLRDGGSLFLHVQPSGNKLWRYRYRMEGQGHVFALGKYPELHWIRHGANASRQSGWYVMGFTL